MPDINQVRRRFRLMLLILLVICLAGAGILLSPIGASSSSRRHELEQLRAELRAKTLENEPLSGIDRQVAGAQDEIGAFYRNRLPFSYAAISERLGALASENGVSLATGRYSNVPSGVPGLQRLLIDASITGDYLHTVSFINTMERENMFFVVDSIALTQQQGRIVQLQIRIETFLKEA